MQKNNNRFKNIRIKKRIKEKKMEEEKRKKKKNLKESTEQVKT